MTVMEKDGNRVNVAGKGITSIEMDDLKAMPSR